MYLFEKHPYKFAFLLAVLTAITNNAIRWVTKDFFGPHATEEATAAVILGFGNLVNIVTVIVITLFLGKTIDDQFEEVKLHDSKTHKYAICVGFVNSLATFILIVVLYDFDAGLVTLYQSGALIFVLLFDTSIGKSVNFKKMWQPALLILLGVILASAENFEINGEAILQIFLAWNFLRAVSLLFTQKGSKHSDGTNFNLLASIYAGIFSVSISLLYSYYHGNLDEYFHLIQSTFIKGFFIMFIIMFLVGYRNGIAATLSKYISVTEIQMIRAFESGLAYGVVLIGALLSIPAFSNISSDFEDIGLRVISIIIVIIGVILLNRSKGEISTAK